MADREESEQRVIELGRGAKSILEDEAFNHACKKLEQEYWHKFKYEALTPESRALVQAQARVLDEVRQALSALKDSATTVELQRTRREKTEASKSNH